MTGTKLRARITLNFQSYWCAGTGGGRGRHLDAVCHRDGQDFPAMPMTEIKGSLREVAVRLADDLVAGWTPDLVNTLFGERTEDGGKGREAEVEFIGNARMSQADKAIDGLADNTTILFRRIAATKINRNGVAEDKTLRFTECAVPVRIEGVIKWRARTAPPANWIELLDAAAAAILAFGKLKNDGNGRAVAEICGLETAPVTTNAIDPALLSAKKIVLVLRQARPAIFNERAATEAAHRTLPAPTGASLLGWCAARGPYADFAKPYQMFHSGAVKFGNAVPVQADGTLAVAFPRNLFAPKGIKSDDDGKLRTAIIKVGPPVSDGSDEIQYEPLKHPFFANDMTRVSPAKGQRLRTATTNGRAAKGQLFGYQHLSTDGQLLFAATIERDDTVCQTDWERLIGVFSSQILSIGRSKSTGYGGGFACTVQLPDDLNAFPTAPVSKRIRVLALSDIALVDGLGCATCHPVAEMFGLPKSLIFCLRDSVISQRRFSPWNAALGSRDLERQVIEAGSVISFDDQQQSSQSFDFGRKCVGAWRETGFGQVWINPDFLADDVLTKNLDAGHVQLDNLSIGGNYPQDMQSDADEKLALWCRAAVDEAPAQGADG